MHVSPSHTPIHSPPYASLSTVTPSRIEHNTDSYVPQRKTFDNKSRANEGFTFQRGPKFELECRDNLVTKALLKNECQKQVH